ncbi:MAG: M6 family metalloprotease domain-containing protein [Candidatus Zixiibacteriota bacterium]|nr:MAG: M6 family metalloprotease domain-containing protein [candidate division Zixibacteria bacterium]
MIKRPVIHLVLLCVFALGLAQPLQAIGPTEEAIRQWIAEGIYEQKMRNWSEFKAAGGCAPNEHSPLLTLRDRVPSALGIDIVDTIQICVILTEFTDWPASGQNYSATPQEFQTLLFSNRDIDPIHNPTGSMTDFYLETSYGTLCVQGDIYGWYMMPETYAHYVGDDDGMGGGGRELAGDAVDAAEAAGVNFAPYANGDLYVDGVIVIHAGPGAETGEYGIWSHRSSITTRYYDGVRISSYTMNPEEYGMGISTMGVFAHEWGHILGLPDLYDINDASPGAGLGRWSMMAGGSWNDNGRTPAHFDAWCRWQLGFVDVVWLDYNLAGVEFPQVVHNPVVYGIGENPGSSSVEYWLIENRQLVGFDAELPGAGLCIFHADNSVFAQNNRFRYKVAMEQADGDNDLAENGGSDAGDPWPGLTNNRDFHDQSVPSSRDNDGLITEVGVWNISNSDSIMTADLDVTFSRAWIELAPADSIEFSDASGGDGDGVLEAGETIDFHVTVVNRMRTGYDPVVTLTVDNDQVSFVQNGVAMAGDLVINVAVTNTVPVQFSLPAEFESEISRFTVTIVADSADGSSDGRFVQSFDFDHALGAPKILVVDDDGGDSWELRLETAITGLRKPSAIWDKSVSSPTGSDLLEYDHVIWHSGKNDGSGGSIVAADVTALKQFLDNNGNLFLSSLTAAAQLQALDSAFMANYLHANLTGTNAFGLAAIGIDGSEVGTGMRGVYDGNAPINPFHDVISATASGEDCFYLADDFGTGNFGNCGVSHVSSYRTIFMTFPIEFISSSENIFGFLPKDTLIKRVLEFFTHSYPYVQSFGVDGEDPGMVVSHAPTFVWSIKDTTASTQTQFEIEVGDDDDWSAAEMWAPGITASADTSTAYAGATLIDGTTYYLRLRVNNGTSWSDWHEVSFHMNSLPLAPLPLNPAENVITDANPELILQNGSDAETSELWYQFEVYSDETLTTVVTTSPNVSEFEDSTSWSVDVSLTELAQHWWRARTYDGGEYSAWSDSAVFTVNSAYEAPTGSLELASLSVLPCDTECVVQPVIVNASKPLTAAVIPIEIPSDVSICDISFDGLVTEAWDENVVTVDSASGYILVQLHDSFGGQIPPEPTTVFNIHFQTPVPCINSEYIFWDTARYDVPAEQLKFTDTMEVFSPDFVFGQDTTEILAYTPGDIDGVEGVDIGDLTNMISFLFIQGDPPCVNDAADVNNDCVGPDIGDLTYLIGYLFISGAGPQCGCTGSSMPPSPKESSEVVLSTSFENGVTQITLNSSFDLRGVQLELAGPSGGDPESLLPDQMDLLVGTPGSTLQVALLDLDGPGVIESGSVRLIRVPGEFEIVGGQVSDMNHQVWAASLSGSVAASDLPATYSLSQNYPNPFNPSTAIRFALPAPAHVKLEVFNVLGRQVVVLVDAEMEAGIHVVDWDGTATGGESVASGIYLYRLVSRDFTQSRKMMLLK